LFVAFTITLDEATTMCTVYVNGEVAYTIALNGAVIPSADVPRLQTETVVGATLISWAFYTEGLVTANGMAIFNAQLKKSAGTIDWAFNAGVVALQHTYSATESMRPLASDVWADTGSVPNAPLTLSEGTPIARVLPGDFAQAVIGPIVDPDGPVVP
jgi:hypothetical protein